MGYRNKQCQMTNVYEKGYDVVLKEPSTMILKKKKYIVFMVPVTLTIHK